MKVTAIQSGGLGSAVRLDAKYFNAPAQRIRAELTALPNVRVVTIGGTEGIGETSMPSRFKRVYAGNGEASVPYLRPYDVFEYLPTAADHLADIAEVDPYRIQVGDILQTCSGRNLGPLTMADEHIAGFVLSHDMIRIRIKDRLLRHYVLGLLRTPTGQHLVRGDLNGSVIDHINDAQISSIKLPVFEDIAAEVAADVETAFQLRSVARKTLSNAVDHAEAAIPKHANSRLAAGWTVSSTSLKTRLDAAFHEQSVRQVRQDISDMGGVRLGDVAQIRKPGGRYKTYYVSEEHGKPLLSGRQLLQADVIAPKHIASRSIRDNSGYELRTNWICFQADGRADEGLGTPVLITAERDGWLASGHVARVMPNDPADAGWLWAALAAPSVQKQISALAAGSVVDALYEVDLENVMVPPRHIIDSEQVILAWSNFAKAHEAESKAKDMLEARLTGSALEVLDLEAATSM